MTNLFASGRIVDLILALMLLEAAVLIALARAWPERIPAVGLLLNLLAGACLLMALRAVVNEADWWITGAWLALARSAHIADLVQRLRTRT